MTVTKALFATMFLSLALFACGGKDKKKTTQPEPVADTAEKVPEFSPEDQPASVEAAKRAAELQQVVYFEFDNSELDAASREKLNENAEWLKEDASRRLTIEGHTDEVGTTEYNTALGERRAQAARDYLLRLGIDESRIRIITYGEERPASDQDELNRRSVFIATRK